MKRLKPNATHYTTLQPVDEDVDIKYEKDSGGYMPGTARPPINFAPSAESGVVHATADGVRDDQECMYIWTWDDTKYQFPRDLVKVRCKGQPLGTTHHLLQHYKAVQMFATEALVLEDVVNGSVDWGTMRKVLAKKIPQEVGLLNLPLYVKFPSPSCPCNRCMRARWAEYQRQYGDK